jgi:GAF domain-containing protein
MNTDFSSALACDPTACQERLDQIQTYQKVLFRITAKIRSSIAIETLSSTTCQDVSRLLGVERIGVYRFTQGWSGQFISRFGFAQAPWDTMTTFGQDLVWQDTHLQETKGGRYLRNETFSVSDIYETNHSRCHLEVLEQFQIRAYAIAPIFIQNQLWGLLAAYQHSGPRSWQAIEVEFLAQVASQLGVAMQHANLLNQVEQKEATMQNQIARQRALAEVVSQIRSTLDTDFILQTACQETCKLLNVERVAVYRFSEDWSGEFVNSFAQVEPQWDSANPFGRNIVWEDTYLQESKGGRYRNNESFAINDIHQAGHSRCHLDILEQYKIRAYAIVPIFAGRNLWGLFAAYQHSSPRQWEATDIEFMSQVGGQIGVAVQQSNILTESEQREQALQTALVRQRALTDIVTKIRSFLDTDTILQTTAQDVCLLLKVDRVAIYQFNEDWSGTFVSTFAAQSPIWEEKNPFGKNMVWEDTFLQETQGGRYRNNESYNVSDIYQMGYARCHLDLLEQYKVKAYALAPIFVGRKLWGLIGLYQHTDKRTWHKNDIQFLEQVGTQIGIALQSATLMMESQVKAEDLQQAADQRQILFDVVSKIRESLDLETIFKTMVTEVRRSLKADRVGVYRFDPTSQYNIGEFVAEDVVAGFPIALGASVVDHCFGENYASKYSRGRMSTITDIYLEEAEDCYLEILERFEIRASVVAPILHGGSLWGLLCVHQCENARHWEEAEIQFVKQVAAQLGVALRQSDLLAQTQAQAEQLAHTLDDLQRTQLQIIQSEKMASLGQLVAGVAHEINNPINFIYGNLTHASEYSEELLNLLALYQKHYPDPVAEIAKTAKKSDLDFLANDLPRLFESMQVGTDRILEIVTSLRNFSRIDEAEFKEVDIHEGIESTLMILKNRFKEKDDVSAVHIVRDFDTLPLIECYPGQLNQVFMNILANALDALEERVQKSPLEELHNNPSTIRITTAKVGREWVKIMISDNGLGMPIEVIQSIFNPFFTTKPVGSGTGLGLSISYQIVTDRHNGKLTCFSESGKGTEFMIEIPVLQRQLMSDLIA